MAELSGLPQSLQLVSDPKSRNKCIAKTYSQAGSLLFSEESFAAILLFKEKSYRCDTCFQRPSAISLKKCSGCGGYWYCNAECQTIHWKRGHKQLCRHFQAYSTSAEFRELQEHKKLDALLLSHTIARLSLLAQPYRPVTNTPGDILFSLLPHPSTGLAAPVICPVKPSPPSGLADLIYSRFGNNNFSIHSHFSSVGHGVFPTASRLFNHSCVPNAAAKYVWIPQKIVTMTAVALRDIQPGEEVCLITLPYLDPALVQTRPHILQISYGFVCDCPSCTDIRVVELPKVPSNPNDLTRIGKELREFVGVDASDAGVFSPPKLRDLPTGLRCVLREDYISFLSEVFSQSSHKGDHEIAIDSGMTLLALYLLIYPCNYPQIGMHLLELTKTTWNKRMSTRLTVAQDRSAKERVMRLLSSAQRVMEVYGPEGDVNGPWEEIDTLHKLLLVV
ncbi:hypothetical protein CPB83DRAFT_757950 [Crepidotus variabilis]|uniref:SET domain-containing protein n=1 Tax=Crepidotus variabilis TaxID=179855 RepID=A0A9P6EPY4_9AGAR|nr:hypothetical protein CPB83DRAFT_757950 [Crepidotus variabilis]